VEGEKERAVVLLSGGVDSSTTVAVALDEGYEVYALTVDYGQRHRREIRSAREVSERMRVREHRVLRLELSGLVHSALTGDGDVPRGRSEAEIGYGIPETYVPARNTVLLSLGLAWAESIGASAVFIGANSVDYSGYPDCRPEFISAFEEAAALGTRCGQLGGRIRIRAPLAGMRKSEIIALGARLGVEFDATTSCYDPSGENGLACGECDSCLIRKRGFEDSGLEDPTRYAGGGRACSED